MKIAIKRVQSQACLGIAEREQFGAKLNKKTYTKPLMEVVAIQQLQLLSGSGNGEKIIPGDPQHPGGAMSPEFEDFDLNELEP